MDALSVCMCFVMCFFVKGDPEHLTAHRHQGAIHKEIMHHGMSLESLYDLSSRKRLIEKYGERSAVISNFDNVVLQHQKAFRVPRPVRLPADMEQITQWCESPNLSISVLLSYSNGREGDFSKLANTTPELKSSIQLLDESIKDAANYY